MVGVIGTYLCRARARKRERGGGGDGEGEFLDAVVACVNNVGIVTMADSDTVGVVKFAILTSQIPPLT